MSPRSQPPKIPSKEFPGIHRIRVEPVEFLLYLLHTEKQVNLTEEEPTMMNPKEIAEKITGRQINGWNDAEAIKKSLEWDNERLGASDGRVTQIGYLEEAKQWFEDQDRKAAERAVISRRAEELSELRSELARAGDDKCDALMVWQDAAGYRQRRNYRTRAGLLRNCIKVVSEGGSIELAG